MTLPHLSDLVAFRARDELEVDAMAERLTASGEFAEVVRPAAGWVVGLAPYPGGAPPLTADERVHALAFAEGRERLAAAGLDRVAAATADTGRLEVLPGDFTFVRCGDDAAVVRSCSGRVPVYWEQDGERVLFATRFAHMIRFRRADPVLDRLVCGTWASGMGAYPDARTFVAGVRLLPRGHVARVGAAGVRVERYWHPRPERARDLVRSPANARELRRLMLEHLDRELDPDRENLLTLSGGMDSSVVGAVAAGVLGRPVASATLLPVGEELRRRDLGYIEGLAAEVPVRLGPMEVLTAELRERLLEEIAVPYPVFQPILTFLPRAQREVDARTVIGGEFADHVCGSTLMLQDWAAHTPPWRLAHRGRLPRGRADVRFWARYWQREIARRPQLPFAPRLPEYVAPDVRDEYAEWLDRRVREAAADGRPRRHFAYLLEREGFVAMHWEVCAARGLRRVHPFITREILELASRCHPADLVGPGGKRLLRDALRGDVPDRHLDRLDKPVPTGAEDRLPARWNGPVPPDVAGLLAPGWPPVEEIPYWARFQLKQLVVFADSIRRARAS